jgi:putative flippase GtrA
MTSALGRYVTAYALGYLLNLAALFVLVDRLNFPHQIVQGVMILVVACFLFVLQRQWVFPARTGVSERASRNLGPG